jgi:dTMP kinase
MAVLLIGVIIKLLLRFHLCALVSTFVRNEINLQMKLFVIEGVDGAGKSTQIKLLRDFFSEKGYSCEYLHFPRTETPFFGELIARFLRGEFGSLNEVDPYLVAMLYAGDRRDASMEICKWMEEGKIVLLDRYTYSNIAYQCAKLAEVSEQDKLKDWILDLEFSHFGIPEPDINVFLDVPFVFTKNNLAKTRTGKDRNYLNGSVDIHEESMLFQKKVREVYLRIAKTDDRLAVLDCGNSDGSMLAPDEIFNRILSILKIRKLF